MQAHTYIYLFTVGAKETQVVLSLEKYVFWPPAKPQLSTGMARIQRLHTNIGMPNSCCSTFIELSRPVQIVQLIPRGQTVITEN